MQIYITFFSQTIQSLRAPSVHTLILDLRAMQSLNMILHSVHHLRSRVGADHSDYGRCVRQVRTQVRRREQPRRPPARMVQRPGPRWDRVGSCAALLRPPYLAPEQVSATVRSRCCGKCSTPPISALSPEIYILVTVAIPCTRRRRCCKWHSCEMRSFLQE